MEVKIGDRVKLIGSTFEAVVEATHEDGSIDARIYKRGHESDGAVTHVLAGNFAPTDAESTGNVFAGEQTSRTQRIDQYHTITH
jgi:hypothetical protein